MSRGDASAGKNIASIVYGRLRTQELASRINSFESSGTKELSLTPYASKGLHDCCCWSADFRYLGCHEHQQGLLGSVSRPEALLRQLGWHHLGGPLTPLP